MTPLINGVSYSSANINVILPIVGAVPGIQSIIYRQDTDVMDNYALGQDPVSRGFGQNKYTGSIEIYKETYDRIVAASPNRNPVMLPLFDIVVTFGGYLGGQAIPFKKEVLRSVTFKSNGTEVKSGDSKIIVKVDLAIAGIEF
jgi:hypothetical protein